MKIKWLGQAGLLFETNEDRILIDPYLSDSVEKINKNNYRRVPVDISFFNIKPTVIVLTHNHLDHTDPDTLKHYLNNDESILVLAPTAAWEEIRQFGGNHNYVRFNRHTTFTHNKIKFTAVKAEHSDIHPIGVIIRIEDKGYYITGDTLYNDEIFDDINEPIDTLFLPVNGVGNNMNMQDALFFAEKVNAKQVVPLHWGMFDEINPNDFKCKNKVIPQIYQEIKL